MSTGGGASVELMQGNNMPGIDNLTDVSELKIDEEMLRKKVTMEVL